MAVATAAVVLRRSVLALVFACLLPTPARALPDLTPEIYDVRLEIGATVPSGDVVEGCAGTTTGLTLVRFGLRSRNVGADTLLVGDPGCPDCATNPGAICTNPQFECSPAGGHNHPHFIDFALYTVLDPAGNLLATAGKRSFCLLDTACSGGARVFTSCAYQGISSGCYDDYAPTLGCQYVDVTGVPDIATRAFRVRATVDPDDLLPDADRGNNVTEVAVPGCGDAFVQAGEDCDGGACCDGACRFLGAGTTCRESAGACEAAAVCDGGSADCPANPLLPDDTPCGITSACVALACRDGACTIVRRDGCVIDGACLAPRAIDPADDCQECVPDRRLDAWSPVVDPDAHGLRCQLNRIATGIPTLACPDNVESALVARVGGLDRLAGRLPGASPARVRRTEKRLARRIAGLSRALIKAAVRGRCNTAPIAAELETLREQLETMRHSQAS